MHRGNGLLLSFFATRDGYSRGNDLSFSLSLTLSHVVSVHTRYTTTHFTKVQQLLYIYPLKVSPKLYLYIYDFRVIYTCVPFQSVESNRYRVFSHPVLPNFHLEGPVSQQTPPSLRHGMSL